MPENLGKILFTPSEGKGLGAKSFCLEGPESRKNQPDPPTKTTGRFEQNVRRFEQNNEMFCAEERHRDAALGGLSNKKSPACARPLTYGSVKLLGFLVVGRLHGLLDALSGLEKHLVAADAAAVHILFLLHRMAANRRAKATQIAQTDGLSFDKLVRNHPDQRGQHGHGVGFAHRRNLLNLLAKLQQVYFSVQHRAGVVLNGSGGLAGLSASNRSILDHWFVVLLNMLQSKSRAYVISQQRKPETLRGKELRVVGRKVTDYKRMRKKYLLYP